MKNQKISPLPQEQLEEYRLSKKEKRQPRCVHCGEPLDSITQTQADYIWWVWDSKAMKYVKDDSGGSSDTPYCGQCHESDDDFVDDDLVNF